LQYKTHDEQRISILEGIITSESQPKYRINLEREESRMNEESTMKCELPASIELGIDRTKSPENIEPSIKSTSRGIVIDLRSESENAHNSMRFSREV
jgi:hypothetical protein